VFEPFDRFLVNLRMFKCTVQPADGIVENVMILVVGHCAFPGVSKPIPVQLIVT